MVVAVFCYAHAVSCFHIILLLIFPRPYTEWTLIMRWKCDASIWKIVSITLVNSTLSRSLFRINLFIYFILFFYFIVSRRVTINNNRKSCMNACSWRDLIVPRKSFWRFRTTYVYLLPTHTLHQTTKKKKEKEREDSPKKAQNIQWQKKSFPSRGLPWVIPDDLVKIRKCQE